MSQPPYLSECDPASRIYPRRLEVDLLPHPWWDKGGLSVPDVRAAVRRSW